MMVLPYEHADQQEEFLIRCEKCSEQVYKSEANVKTGPDRPYYSEFWALGFYADAIDEFNASHPIYSNCNYGQTPVPAEQVGWRRYAMQIDVANRARSALEQLAAERTA